MIYCIGFISGLINGVFASGAGQILIFYLIFIKKIDAYMGRAISLFILSISSIFTFFNYIKYITIKINNIFIIVLISIVFGFIGNKLMFKINKNNLNLISGILLAILSIYGLVR